jgi:hypothetical protein
MGLRARITLAFTLGALVLSALLAGTTFALTRENLPASVSARRSPPSTTTPGRSGSGSRPRTPTSRSC